MRDFKVKYSCSKAKIMNFDIFSRDKHTSPMRKVWESWGCWAWRRLWGDLIAAF